MARGQGATAEDVLYGEFSRNGEATPADSADLRAVLPTLSERVQADLDVVALACLEAPVDQAGTITIERMERQAPDNLTEAAAQAALWELERHGLIEQLDPEEHKRRVGGRTTGPGYKMSDLGAQIYKIRWDTANQRSRM